MNVPSEPDLTRGRDRVRQPPAGLRVALAALAGVPYRLEVRLEVEPGDQAPDAEVEERVNAVLRMIRWDFLLRRPGE